MEKTLSNSLKWRQTSKSYVKYEKKIIRNYVLSLLVSGTMSIYRIQYLFFMWRYIYLLVPYVTFSYSFCITKVHSIYEFQYVYFRFTLLLYRYNIYTIHTYEKRECLNCIWLGICLIRFSVALVCIPQTISNHVSMWRRVDHRSILCAVFIKWVITVDKKYRKNIQFIEDLFNLSESNIVDVIVYLFSILMWKKQW